MDAIFFYAFALLTLAGGLLTITLRSAVHSAVSLMASLLGVAGLFLMQHAEFLFATQIVLYIGGIMLLFLFVIMLVNLDEASKTRQYAYQWPVAAVAAAAVGIGVIGLLRRGTLPPPPAEPASRIGNVEQVADLLFSEYLLPFEVVSLLLLVAVVGSVLMAQKSGAKKRASL
jgi:NADH-quinone oxidoreductase subunit J